MPRPDADTSLSPVKQEAAKPGPQSIRESEKHNTSSPISDANFELLFSHHPLPMFVLDAETFQILEINDAAVQSYGYSRDEFLRMNAKEIRPPEDIPRLLEVMRSRGTAASSRERWRHRRKNGEVFYVEVSAQRMKFGGGDVLLTVARDISARVHAEDQVAEHTSLLQAMIENNPLAIVSVDSERRVQVCNPAFEHMFGYPREEVLGKRIEALTAPPGHESEMVKLIETVRVGKVVKTTAVRRRRNGSLIDVRILGVPVVVEGKLMGSLAVYEDISERARSEEARRLAEERYRRIFESAVEGFFESTPGGHFVTVNPAMARIAGYSSPTEMIAGVYDIGKQLYVDPEQRKDVKRRLEEDGIIEGYEVHMLRKDGSKIWISMNVSAVRDSSGKVISHDGTAVDITERKRSELERQVTTEIAHAVAVTENLDDLLRVIHQSLRKVVSAENCFVGLLDSSTGIFHFPFFVDKFDAKPAPRQLGRGTAAYVLRTGQAMSISEKRFKELLDRGDVEGPYGTPARSWLGVPLRTPAAKIGVLAVRDYERDNAYSERDVEFLSSIGNQIALAIERKQAEDKLRASEARLRVLVEQLPAVLWTVDKNLIFTSVVGAGLKRLGLKPNQLVGKSLNDYFETPDRTFLPIAAHLKAVCGDPTTFHVEWKDASYACHVEPLRNAEGEAEGAICMSLDVTDRKQLEEQFRQAQKMEAVGRLAGGIAHDFNNLLMVIQGYADLMVERVPAGDSLRRNAEQIRMAAQRAASLTRQLLAFSRKQILEPKVLNVQTIVADMEKILRRLIGEDIDLVTSSAKDLGLVKVDRGQIEQVIMNLAVNARDAMPNGGRLTIETANVELDASMTHASVVLAPGKYVMLAVTDNGCGMDEATQAHIFEPFFTTKEQGKGTGLGLATVYGVVKQSGGYVWVYSEPGHGTTFKIYLPRIDEGDSTSTGDIQSDASSRPKGSEVVLLVEDEQGVRELAQEYLQMCGYKVLTASDGHAAVELASMHSGPIHLLMTDVVMPGISGRELADRVSAIRPDIKVLYMSGYTDRAISHHGILETGAVFLQKPFTLSTLAAKLREILATETIQQA